ncbi:MAG: hypothetical protein V4844_00825 [Pseudomonadota bacterium]
MNNSPELDRPDAPGDEADNEHLKRPHRHSSSTPTGAAAEQVGTHPLGAAAGGIGGAVAGAVAGIAAGPVGSLAGAIGGAVAGAAAGSGAITPPATGPADKAGEDPPDSNTASPDAKRPVP